MRVYQAMARVCTFTCEEGARADWRRRGMAERGPVDWPHVEGRKAWAEATDIEARAFRGEDRSCGCEQGYRRETKPCAGDFGADAARIFGQAALSGRHSIRAALWFVGRRGRRLLLLVRAGGATALPLESAGRRCGRPGRGENSQAALPGRDRLRRPLQHLRNGRRRSLSMVPGRKQTWRCERLRARPEISDTSSATRRPAGEARGGGILDVLRRRATKPAGMDRRRNRINYFWTSPNTLQRVGRCCSTYCRAAGKSASSEEARSTNFS